MGSMKVASKVIRSVGANVIVMVLSLRVIEKLNYITNDTERPPGKAKSLFAFFAS